MGHWLLGHHGPSLWQGTLASAKGEGERPCVLRCSPTGLRAGDGLHGGDEGKWYGHPATLCRWARLSSCRLWGSSRAHPRPADVGDPAQELAQRHWEVFVGTGKRRLPERERVSASTGMNQGDGSTAKKENEAVFTEICLFLTRVCARLLQHPTAHPVLQGSHGPHTLCEGQETLHGSGGFWGQELHRPRLGCGLWQTPANGSRSHMSVRKSTSSRSTSQIHGETDRPADRGGRVPEDG